MVTTQDEEVLGVFDLVCQKKADGLERLLATVNIVTEEEVVGLWREAAVFEETEEIIVLAMDIAANLNLGQAKRVSSAPRHGEGRRAANKHTLIGASSSRRMG